MAVSEESRLRRGDGQAVAAGVVAAVIGFAGAFTVVLAGLRAVGATSEQASSGLLVLSVGMGLCGLLLSWRTRMPISVAWSTPGAALLIAAGPVHGGWAAALGAFALAGLLTVVAGLVPPFEHAVARIPGPIASALLAGVLLPVCLAPVRAAVELPSLALPVVGVWAVLMKFARRLAVPGALAAAIVALAIDGRFGGGLQHPAPALVATLPVLDLRTLLGVGIPLFVVTMASQNLTGMSVLALHGYRPRLGPLLTSTGAASAVGAPFGAHGINLAAITAALMAGPDAGPDRERRWIAAAASGVAYVVLGFAAGLATALIATSPPLLIEAVAGLALLGSLAGAVAAATAEEPLREAALITLVVTASQVTALGLSAPVWGLAAGLAYWALLRPRGAAGHRPGSR